MKSDIEKSKNELIEEMNILRRRVADADEFQQRFAAIQQEYHSLKQRLEEQKIAYNKECAEQSRIQEALQMAQVIIHQSPVVLFRRLAGDDPKLIYVSDNIAQFGYTAEDFLNGKIHYGDIVHPDDHERLKEEIEEYVEKDVEEYTQVYRILTKKGDIRWIEDQTSVVRDKYGDKIHHQGIVVDITRRKLAEDQLRKSEVKFRRIVETAGEGFILMDEDLHIIDMNDAYCRMLGYSREELLGKTPLDLATDKFREYMLANREKILSQEYREFEGSSVRKDGGAVPILVHGNTLRDDRGNVIGNMAFITDMTEHKKAMALAGEVQKSLLPHGIFEFPGLDVAGKNISSDEIGGDYFDFLLRRENPTSPFNVAVGDITGHGVDAALLMTTARAFLRMRTSQPGSLSEIVTAMNRHLTEDVLESGRFMTLFYMAIDSKNDRIDWVRAGHDPAVIYDPKRDLFDELKGDGLALGIDESFEYKENHKTGIADGKIIAIGTDGIWEARNKDDRMFGKARFREIIRKTANSGAGDILNAVFNELHEFTQGQKFEDDITLVIVKSQREGPTEGR